MAEFDEHLTTPAREAENWRVELRAARDPPIDTARDEDGGKRCAFPP
jgi:hypothetical protein